MVSGRIALGTLFSNGVLYYNISPATINAITAASTAVTAPMLSAIAAAPNLPAGLTTGSARQLKRPDTMRRDRPTPLVLSLQGTVLILVQPQYLQRD